MNLTGNSIAIGTLALAAATFVVTNILEIRRRSWERTTQSYIDFLDGRSIMLEPTTHRESEEFRHAMQLQMKAKHRIVLFARQEVVRALAQFYEGDGEWSAESITSLTNLINAMRTTNSRGAIERHDIERILTHPLPGRKHA